MESLGQEESGNASTGVSEGGSEGGGGEGDGTGKMVEGEARDMGSASEFPLERSIPCRPSYYHGMEPRVASIARGELAGDENDQASDGDEGGGGGVDMPAGLLQVIALMHGLAPGDIIALPNGQHIAAADLVGVLAAQGGHDDDDDGEDGEEGEDEEGGDGEDSQDDENSVGGGSSEHDASTAVGHGGEGLAAGGAQDGATRENVRIESGVSDDDQVEESEGDQGVDLEDPLS